MNKYSRKPNKHGSLNVILKYNEEKFKKIFTFLGKKLVYIIFIFYF